MTDHVTTPPELACPDGLSRPSATVRQPRENSATVTRIEFANHVQAAFAVGPATRDNLLAYAAGSHARPAIIAVIQTLPERTYPSIRDLWYHLPDVPITG